MDIVEAITYSEQVYWQQLWYFVIMVAQEEKLLLDEQAKLAHAEQEGMEKGIEQGKMQMIRGMHEIGVPLETIAKASKLSLKEIERILKLK
ncbi:putative transposase/invertase (TIGR01784 family) [Bacillus sp. RC252]